VPTGYEPRKAEDTSNYVLDKQQFVQYKIFEHRVNSYQYFFQYRHNNLINDSLFNLIVKESKYENIHFSDFFNDYTAAILVGTNRQNTIFIIPDLNNDNDFRNDIASIFSFATDSSELFKLPNIVFDNIVYNLGNGSQQKSLQLSFDIDLKIDKADFKNCKIELRDNQVFSGQLTTQAQSIPFQIKLESPGHDFLRFNNIKISYGNIYAIKKYSESEKTFFKLKDTVYINGYNIILDSVSTFGERAYFKVFKSDKPFSISAYFSTLVGQNLQNSKNEHLLKTRKYKVIDVWATWCGPCLEQHKVIKIQLGDLIASKKIELIGLLWDKKENITKAKTYLKTSKISWSNFFLHGKSVDAAKSILNIASLPTYFLFDERNNIIVRTGSIEDIISALRAKN